MIRVKNLTKNYGELKAVDDISFEVKTGEIVGFLGPNAAGKTTTMRIITCFMPPTSGTVEVDDLNIFDNSLEIRGKIGYLPENAPLYWEMNVVEYLEFIMGLRGVGKDNFSQRKKDIIDLCGLGSVTHKDIGELSKGFRQRVGLAQAMIHNPEILILDEPTIGLDPNQIVEIRNLIKQLGREKTVILSTHILPEVEATCGRVLIIHEGKIVADGTPKELQSGFEGKERIYLELKKTVENIESKLKMLEQVEKVEKVATPSVETRGFYIESDKGVDLREKLFNYSVQNNWTILEMRREQASLEQIFRLLTRS
ncbi:MAG: ATP-binding cassette domain-containing protein [candidate division Zixibacteria bacterium]|nr:ATP-binding cassette domain-containing protein [candidate division Zixibacteria bacterium]